MPHNQTNVTNILGALLRYASHTIQKENYLFDWQHRARPSQLVPDGSWRVWLIMAGRGFGKTRTGAETIRQWVHSHNYRHLALIAHTEAEGRRVMIEGPSGLLNVHPLSERPVYEPSKQKLTWANGAVATLYSSENVNQLRGPQFDGAWVDELAKFRQDQETWDQLNFALRLGKQPRIIITTTPRPTPLIKQLLSQEGQETYVTRGTTFENSDNLAPDYISHLKQRYAGTVLGDQEIQGLIINNMAGALWTFDDIAQCQITQIPPLDRIVVAIDPAVTHNRDSDETGIIVAGIDGDCRGYVLYDGSLKSTPYDWAKCAINLYHQFQADCIVAEINQGGDLVETMLRTIDQTIPYKGVHARRGKVLRAEPIAALYKQHRVFHKISPNLRQLEHQLCHFIPGQMRQSPDRLDALVWALTELMIPTANTIMPKLWINNDIN